MINSPSLSSHPSPNVSSIGSMVSSLCPSTCTTSKMYISVKCMLHHLDHRFPWKYYWNLWRKRKTNQTPLCRFFSSSMMDGWLDKMQNLGSETKKRSSDAPFHLIEILIKFRWTYSKKQQQHSPGFLMSMVWYSFLHLLSSHNYLMLHRSNSSSS